MPVTAELFLNQLLRVENSVQPTTQEPCIICLSNCNTLCPSTGVVEYEMRLPCGHTVGSRCIAIWLDPDGVAKNSCPVCRHVFFPLAVVQARPYRELGIHDANGIGEGFEGLEDDEEATLSDDEETSVQEEANHEEGNASRDRIRHYNADLVSMCESFSYRLHLDAIPSAINISIRIAERINFCCRLVGHSTASVAAVAVFVASHVVRAPKAVHWVSMMSGVEVDAIVNVYSWLHEARDRVRIVDDETLAMVGRARGRGVGSLPVL